MGIEGCFDKKRKEVQGTGKNRQKKEIKKDKAFIEEETLFCFVQFFYTAGSIFSKSKAAGEIIEE